MLFTSTNFLMFLAVLFVLYQLFPQKHRWFVLLAGSMTFYGFAGHSFLVYICATIVTTFFCTIRIKSLVAKRDEFAASTDDKEVKKVFRLKTKSACKKWFIAGLVFNFGILSVVKYADFAIGNTNALLQWAGSGTRFTFMHFALPMGISFYTFQTMGYLIDVYREKVKPETNLFKLALFTSFFPQIIQGPISRFGELSQTLYNGDPLRWHSFWRGAQRILIGFFKKLVIADRLWPALETLTATPAEYRGAYYLFSIGLYAIILFCDFTGGLDITIGIAEMFGIKLAENFKRPFYARSIQEYWQRWHITMYTWFRDYVFYPMSVGKSMLRFTKFARRIFGDFIGKRMPLHVSLQFVWFLTGLWHGATWNFIAWGMANGIVIAISLEFQPLYKKFHTKFPWAEKFWVYRCFQIFRTFWLMNMIRSFDIYVGVGNTLRMMLSVFTDFDLSGFLYRGVSDLGLEYSAYISAGAGLLVLFWVSYLGRGEVDFRDRIATYSWRTGYVIFGIILLMVIILGAYGIGYDARQFIYNQF
ncbi:MAG: MBOAT family protein [Firmicutes bacterium]|nr:MBOAT family protein [Bacillota bacterium]